MGSQELSTIKKILIPVDFSETSQRAIAHGAFMANLYRADLVLVHVIEKHFQQFSVVSRELLFQLPTDLVERIRTQLDEVAENIRNEFGVVITAITTEGTICEEIIAAAEAEKVDLIVMGTHGTSGLSEMFLGSNANKVVTLSACPVLTVQSSAERIGFSNLLLPIDNSPHSRQKVNTAIYLAKSYGSSITLLGLVEEGNQSEASKFKIKLDQTAEFIKKEGVPVVTEMRLNGNLGKNTLAAARELKSDLIVIMTDQDENFSESFLGSYAQQIVNHSRIPVLSIKPKINPNNLEWGYPHN